MSCAHSRFAAVVLACLIPSVTARAQDSTPRKYAVLVGVNNYEHQKFPALSYAEADVTALAAVLKKAGYQVTLLTGAAKQSNLRPTKKNIEAKLRVVLRGCRAGDTAVLAFAGHGLQFEKQQQTDPDDAYFCPQDARPFRDERGSLVSLAEVYKEMDRSFAGMKVLLVDACRDDPDAARGSRGGITADSVRPPAGVAALFSCRAGERAYEHDTLKHGVFFHHVLEGLTGKAKDADNEVTFAGLAAYVSRRVAKEVPALVGGSAKQTPAMEARYAGEPVLLTVKVSGRLDALPVILRRTGELTRQDAFDRQRKQSYAKTYKVSLKAGTVYRIDMVGKVGQAKPPLDAFLRLEDAEGRELAFDDDGGGWPHARLFYRPATDGVYTVVATSFDPRQTGAYTVTVAACDLRELRARSEPVAAYDLGLMAEQGWVVKNDAVEAVRWYRKAADQGYLPAQVRLASMYAEGLGVVKDEDEAAGWFLKAADQGNSMAQANLGLMYAEGRGVAKDESEGARWLKRAAEQGNAVAQNPLGWMYQNGRGVAKDEAEAVRWFRKAAEQGNGGAQTNLAASYETGRGVTKDEAEAIKWYRKAATQGDAVAQNNLGVMYGHGRGVPKDQTEALRLYRKSAAQGFAPAQYNLGWMYEKGLGVNKNVAEARRWYRLAADQGNENARAALERLQAGKASKGIPKKGAKSK
jgi:TPR repeat protein